MGITTLLGIVQNKWFWIISLVLVIGYFGYNLYMENQQLKYEKQKSEQNARAANDALTKARDSIQTLAVGVDNLNQKNNDLIAENSKVKNEYRALYTKYDVAIRSISDSGKGLTACGDDSDTVEFSGTKDIASFKGQTITFLKTCTSTWSLDISFAPIDIRSELYLDELDNIWKIRTISMSPGITLRGISKLDDETFKKLRDIPDANTSKTRIFGIGALFGSQLLAPGIEITPNSWQFGAHYILLDNTKLLDSWQDRLIISVHYFPF